MFYYKEKDIINMAKDLQPTFDTDLAELDDSLQQLQNLADSFKSAKFKFDISIHKEGTRDIFNSIYLKLKKHYVGNSLKFAYAIQTVYGAIITDMIRRVYDVKYRGGSHYINKLNITDDEIKSFFEFMKQQCLDPFEYICEYEQTCQGYSDLYFEMERIMSN